VNGLSIIVAIFCAGVAQAVGPTWAALGHMPLPALPALTVYYALTRDRTVALWIAIAAGVVQDALGPVPMGYSSCCLGAAAILINRYREEVFEWEGLTHMIFGGLTAAGTALSLGLMIGAGADARLSFGRVVLKTAGAGILGAAVAPIVCSALSRLEMLLGMREEARR
jgi:rod shape-determining protein MreD